MRTLLLGDIIAAARALLALPAENRPSLLEAMIRQADAAHRFHKRRSRQHPEWGNGSLMARANIETQVAEPMASDCEYLRVLCLVLEGVISHKLGARFQT